MTPEHVHTEIYGMFYTEIGVKNISEAVKKVGYGKQFAKAFRNSNAYTTFANKIEQKKIAKEQKLNSMKQQKEYIIQRNETILKLHKEQGLNYREIAKKIGVAAPNVYIVLKKYN